MFESFGRYLVAKASVARDIAHVHRGYQILGGQVVRPVTIKRLHPTQARSAEQAAMLLEEGRITARFEHANIVGLVDMDQVEGQWFLAFERVQGQDLATVVKKAKLRGVNIDAQTALYLAIQVLQGLSHAHERTDADGNMLGIVHRDVCPENVMIGYGGEVKLTGFLYAKVRGRTNPPQPGAPRPRYGHMSPEQALATDVDHRADIFSLGLILYELLSGMTAYDARSDLDAFSRAQRGQVRSLLEVAPTLGPDLREVVEKALIFDRKMRHPSALVFRDELARILYSREPTFAAYRIATMMARVLGDEATEDRTRESEERVQIEQTLIESAAGLLPGMMPSFNPQPSQAPAVLMAQPLNTLSGYSSLQKGFPAAALDGPQSPPPPIAIPTPTQGSGRPSQVNVPTALIEREPRPGPHLVHDLLSQAPLPPPAPPPPIAAGSVLSTGEQAFSLPPASTGPNLHSPLASSATMGTPQNRLTATAPTSPPPPPPPSHPSMPVATPSGSGAISTGSIPIGFVPELRGPPEKRRSRIGLAVIGAVFLIVACVSGFALSSEHNMRVVRNKLRAAVIGRQPGGVLVLDSLPQGARVTVDGEKTGKKTPLTIENFESGIEHEITVELDGESAVTSSVSIKPGQKRNLTLFFPDAIVDLSVKSDPPGAEVWIDRKSIGFAPDAVAKVKAGQEINLRVTKVGYIDYVKTLLPERKKPIALEIKLEKTEALIAQEAAEAAALKEANDDDGVEEESADGALPANKDADGKPAKKKKRPRNGPR